MVRIAVVSEGSPSRYPPEYPSAADADAALVGYLRRCGWEIDQVDAAATAEAASAAATADCMLVLGGRPTARLTDRISAGRPTLLAGPVLDRWREVEDVDLLAGLLPAAVTPRHEIRVRPGTDAGVAGGRLIEFVLADDRIVTIDKTHDDALVLLTANVANTEHPVAALHQGIGVLTLGWTASTRSDPAYHRVVHNMLRALLGYTTAAPVQVGLLGYGAIGQEHSAAIAAVPGLELAAVCDRSAERRAAALGHAPDARGYDDATDLLADSDVDLIVVSTPPNTHAEWTLRGLRAGKSVLVEKPFCLTVAEADAQISAAAGQGLTLAVYQNRRWDADYVTLRRAIRDGAIGEVFHYESFVGGYGHPCNYWHSDERVSGGAIYDWGSHYLDWVLDLFPQTVDWVSATAHKRVWHDVTNADHTRVLVHFCDGVEAEFTHSDLAAAPKPKWYVLGTRGALVGSWRTERVVGRDRVGNLMEDVLAPADSPAALHIAHPDGSRTALAVPSPEPFAFHRELADHLLTGTPMSVTPQGSRRNIALMEAATESSRRGGKPVEVHGP